MRIFTGIVIIFMLMTAFVMWRVSPRPVSAPRPIAHTPAVAIDAAPAPSISAENMMQHMKELAGTIGARKSGAEAELRAARYVADQFAACGYDAQWMDVPLPNGRTSHNVYAELPGKSAKVVLVGAHIDSKSPSPGANDNASGVAVLLELARVLKDVDPPFSVMFVAFGAEEMIDRHRDHHHYGSRLMARDASLIARLHSVTSIDMVGVGTRLHIENTGKASDRWRDHVSITGKAMGLPVRCRRGRPFSDHEAFEKKGISAAYIHWERDSAYHTRRDTPDRVSALRLQQTAEMVRRAIATAE